VASKSGKLQQTDFLELRSSACSRGPSTVARWYIYFHTKNHTLCIFRKALEWKNVGIFNGHSLFLWLVCIYNGQSVYVCICIWWSFDTCFHFSVCCMYVPRNICMATLGPSLQRGIQLLVWVYIDQCRSRHLQSIISDSETQHPLQAGLPDGIFSYQKSNLGTFWRPLEWEMLTYVCILWTFGVFYQQFGTCSLRSFWVFSPFWYAIPRKSGNPGFKPHSLLLDSFWCPEAGSWDKRNSLFGQLVETLPIFPGGVAVAQ
jgi:hypothetical protein